MDSWQYLSYTPSNILCKEGVISTPSLELEFSKELPSPFRPEPRTPGLIWAQVSQSVGCVWVELCRHYTISIARVLQKLLTPCDVCTYFIMWLVSRWMPLIWNTIASQEWLFACHMWYSWIKAYLQNPYLVQRNYFFPKPVEDSEEKLLNNLWGLRQWQSNFPKGDWLFILVEP